MVGGDGKEYLIGNIGNDILFGNAGDDIDEADYGKDTLDDREKIDLQLLHAANDTFWQRSA